MSAASTSGSRLAGPMVATMRVRRFMARKLMRARSRLPRVSE
jgi:hypothetical protein